MTNPNKSHPGKAGRKPSPGFRKDAPLRFLDENEVRVYFDNTTPRQRVEIVLAWLEERKNET